MSDIIEFRSEFSKPFDTQYKSIDEILNKPILIKDIAIIEFQGRQIIHILAEDLEGNEFAFRTSSKVIIKQLTQFEKHLKEGKKLKCKITKRKRYYTLAPPS